MSSLRFTVSNKLYAGFISVIVFLGLLGGISITNMKKKRMPLMRNQRKFQITGFPVLKQLTTFNIQLNILKLLNTNIFCQRMTIF